MRIAIHKKEGNSKYVLRWIEYCEVHKIDYKIVNAYSNTIIEDLKDCSCLLWHYSHNNYKDILFAKQLLFSLEQSGKKVFPDFNTAWHFDDKLGQKYLFESHNIPAAKAYVFYDKKTAIEWLNNTTFPKIFKLRGGAGSSNVRMISSKSAGRKVVNRAFNKGFKTTNYLAMAKDKLLLFTKGRSSFYDVAKYLGMFLFPKRYNKHLLPIHKGYVYFQEFIPNDGYDIRVEITGDKAIALVRYTREGDFRASGSNNIIHDSPLIDKQVILFAFEVAKKLQLQSCALDIVRCKDTKKLYVIENSYCYGVDDDEFEYGYWTKDGIYHKDEKFNGLDWIIESLIKEVI